ncbi:molybdopterin molybdenumtransferase MoeA [Agromyces sp. CFH 90414]|uniref:Molybdopterin molybdenumtransferase n=1 Tax=Agromyces agglutinans TaxID=2662258 RepID=A0A6I2FBF1_9MICO|nr:gephyrin-like molybdotransferase Glp [Agromyces agglutinans]MRG61147.1 molybdopterin molybdenumtransferase MoeA [Agromyces agglutinans]
MSDTPPVEVEVHLADLLAATHRLPAVTVPLAAALGRVLATDVVAVQPVPRFDNSAMDGYAVRRADVIGASEADPVALDVIGEVAAGSADDPPLFPGQAVRIMTGAALPTAADAVVPVEHTAGYRASRAWAEVGASVEVVVPAVAGAHVRRAGEDLSVGDLVLPAGVVLTPFRLGAAAAAGVGEVEVVRAPRVAVVATGDELVPPGTVPARGQIPESNSVLLAAAVARAGGEVVSVARVGDDPADLLAHLDRLATERSPDLVVCTGGVSVGAHDVVKAALTGRGVTFRGVAMQPGKPQAFGRLDSGALCVGLPGNPVSVAVSFEVFVRPALQAMQGLAPVGAARTEAEVADGWRSPPGRRQFMPIAFGADGRIRRATGGGSGSHLAGGLAQAEGFAIVAAEASEVSPGDRLPVMLVES